MGEAFSVQPFGNKIVTMTLSGTQIDALLEQQQFDNTSFGNKGLLQASKGFRYTWSKSAPIGKKVNISSIMINGTSIDHSALYRVTVDSFMAEGGNNLSVLKAGINRSESSLDDMDVIANYFNHFSPVAPGHMDRIAVIK